MAYAMIGNQARPKKEYIATAPFNSNFFTYTAIAPSGTNPTNTGKLTPVTGATQANCPAGRILRETGAHLYPGANPGLLPTDANYNVFATHGSHIFTKVYDAVTGLSGYIDANDTMFATYSNERPEEFVDVGETDGSRSRKGPSVFTGGNVTIGGQIALIGTTKAITYVATTSPYAFGASANLNPFYSFAAAAAVAITATSVPPTGTTLTVFYSGAFTTTPGTGFVGATIAPTGTQCIAVSYVSNGTVLIEYARSGALPSVPTFP